MKVDSHMVVYIHNLGGAMKAARRWWALGGVQLAVLAVGLDITVLSVALPTLATALHASEDLQWFPPGTRWCSRQRCCAAGSLACAYAPSAGAFLAARLALGLAGAGLVVMAVSALVVLFSEEERQRAVTVWAAANFLALPIGLLASVRAAFVHGMDSALLVSAGIAAVGIVLTLAFLPGRAKPLAAEHTPPERHEPRAATR